MQSEPLAMLSSGADEAHWPQSWVVCAGQAVGVGLQVGIGVRLHAELGDEQHQRQQMNDQAATTSEQGPTSAAAQVSADSPCPTIRFRVPAHK